MLWPWNILNFNYKGGEYVSKELTISNELGKALVEQAQELTKKKTMEQCLVEVQTVLNLIDLTKSRIDEQEKRLKIYQTRLEAINKGKISLMFNQNGQAMIQYNDENLRQEKVGY